MNKTLTLEKRAEENPKFFYSRKPVHSGWPIDLCEAVINKLWPNTKNQTKIRVKVSRKRPHQNSIPIRIILKTYDNNDMSILRWKTSEMPEYEDLACQATAWLLSRYPSLKSDVPNIIHMSVK